jgi:hypothetical protein
MSLTRSVLARSLFASSLALAASNIACAAFTGITVTATAGPSSTSVGPTTIYRMWATFDSTGGNAWGVTNFRFTSAVGFTGFVHNDNFTSGAYTATSGSWFTMQSNSTYGATDSWVSLTEPTTFPVSSAIPSGSWSPADFYSNPQLPGILGAGVSWRADPQGPFWPVGGQQLLGQFVISSTAQICLAAEIECAFTPDGGGVPTAIPVTFDFNANCVPAPGALALFGVAGLARRRRR